MRRAGTIIAIPLALLASCASGLPGLRPLTYSTPGEPHVFASGQPCPHEQAGTEVAGLVAAALTGAASQLLKNFGTALSEGAKGGALPASVSTTNLELDPGAAPRCLVVIRGSFQPGGAVGAIDLASWLGLAGDPEVATRLKGLAIPSVYRIDHYVELRVASSQNGRALTFAPMHVRLNRSIDGASKGERDMSIAVKFGRVGADATGSAIVLADRRIGAAGVTWTPVEGRRLIEAPWFASFHAAPSPAGGAAAPAGAAKPAPNPPPAGPVGGGGAIGAPPPGAPRTGYADMRSSSRDAVPTTVTVTVVETRPTNEALAFVASVFGAVQPKIDEKLKTVIDSDARRTAEVAEETGQLALDADYATALGGAQAATITYCSTASTETTAAGRQDRITKSQTARTAQIKANAAAIKAGGDRPFSSPIAISSDLPAAANPTGCTAG